MRPLLLRQKKLSRKTFTFNFLPTIFRNYKIYSLIHIKNQQIDDICYVIRCIWNMCNYSRIRFLYHWTSPNFLSWNITLHVIFLIHEWISEWRKLEILRNIFWSAAIIVIKHYLIIRNITLLVIFWIEE